jgi:hypothetical protein
MAIDTSLWADDVWVIDSTRVECGRSRDSVLRSDLAGWAQYGYCASHSRYFWGLRLHLLTTLHGLPAGFAITGAKSICGSPAWRETGLPECYGFVKVQAFAESSGMVW